MIRHPDHHHMPPNGIQRNPRLGLQHMPAPQQPPAPTNQTMLMSLPPGAVRHSGVLVSLPPPGPTVIASASVSQSQPLRPSHQPAHHYEPTMAGEALNEQHPVDQNATSNTTTLSAPPPNLANTKEKTPMCLINELARYNKIQHQYRLTGEQGPAHKKLFTVTLKLGHEEYEAEGASIKKAQHSAAAMALQNTEFKHPPPKTNRNNRIGIRNGSGMVTPTVELNALAMKRGERTEYVLESAGAAHQAQLQQPYYPRHNFYGPGQPRYNFDPRRNHSGRNYHYDNRGYYGGQYRYQQPTGEPFAIRLRVGDREYPGVGNTVQAARHDAASKALEDIKIRENNDTQPCPVIADGVVAVDNTADDLNSDLKSPISLVHEIALKRNLNVVFEVMSEKGPPHMKVFITQCRVGEMVADGEGNGKKISKKRAAEKMLEKLSSLGPLPSTTNVLGLKRKRIVNKKKQRNLIKMNTDRSADYPEEINPISRLIQIQQANKEKEPIYTVIEERGAPRRREFVIEARVNDHSCTGVGPNKKVAKRSAAEALLALLESSKQPMKQPDKENDNVEKTTRKGTFIEEKVDNNVGGSGGRQLVPGLLLVNDQSAGFQQVKMKGKTSGSEMSNNAAGSATIEPKKLPAAKTTPQATPSIRAKDQLIYLAQLLGIEVHFSDFPKANHEMYLTLVSLNTTPPQVCHGEGATTEASHEKASLEALNVLSELGLDNVTPTKENTVEGSHLSGKPQLNPKPGVNQNGIKK